MSVLFIPAYSPLCSCSGVHRGVDFFSIFAAKHRLWVLLEQPWQVGEHGTTINVLGSNKKNP